jgi:hypothetical protein
MAPFDKIPPSHDPDKPGRSTQSLLRDDYGDDVDDEDAGERALLSEETQTRWQEATPLNTAALWKQTSGIVVEVSTSSRRSAFPDLRALDTTNPPFHDAW